MTPVATSVHESWPASNIEFVPIDSLTPYIRNPRQHSPEQIAQLVRSMEEFGWVNPVLRDENGMIIAGHGRILAAKQLKWTEAPVMTARGWSEAKKRAYVIADNKLALNATWDLDLLSTEIDALKADDYDIDLLGFSDDDLQRMADDLMSNRFGAAGEGGSAGSDAAPRADVASADQVALTLPMTVSQRETVFEAIEKAKREFGLLQGPEALWRICRLYLETETQTEPQ